MTIDQQIKVNSLANRDGDRFGRHPRLGIVNRLLFDGVFSRLRP
jgi:hypothetical protein